MSKALKDEKARQRIAQDLENNFLVEAGAGSGKTSSLVKRMISEVKFGKFKVNEIAAITFTRKAAGELKERFQTALEKEYSKSTNKDEKQRLKEALSNLDQCFLGTVHSFCGRVLRERPIEAGLDPEFKELEEIDDRILMEEAWANYLLDTKLNNYKILQQLDEIGINPSDLKSSYNMMCTYPDVAKTSIKSNKPDPDDALNKILELIREAKPFIPSAEPEKGYDKLQAAILKAYKIKRYLDMSLDTNKIKIIEIFDCKLDVTQNRWLSKPDAKRFKDEVVPTLKDIYINPTLRSWREYCHYYIQEFLIPATKYYEELRYKNSYLNFQDLLMKTLELLKENPEVRQYFQNKYKCLLVDEFQDTDPIQAEIVFYLTGEDLKEKDWKKLVPKKGSLFVVGDPKQSIYRFRRADIDIYNLVKELIVKSGGEVLNLTSNFRSLKAIGDHLNPIFENVFLEESTVYQAAFAPLETIRENKRDTSFGVRQINIPSEYSKKDEVVVKDAENIAKLIKYYIDNGIKISRAQEEIDEGIGEEVQYKDFMILLRYKDNMETYARTLEEYGIPVTMTGSSSLSQSIEIIELYKLLRLLNDPENQVLLVAVLRGLFFGISDNSLYQFKKNNGYFSFFSEAPDLLEQGDKNMFNEAFERLGTYYGWIRKYSPAVAVEKILSDIGLIPYSLVIEDGQCRSGDIYFILERIRKLEADGVTNFSSIIKQLGVLLSSKIEDELNISPIDNSVRLMNLHKAKGLEAPIVFLAHPCMKVGNTPDKCNCHIARVKGDPSGHFAFIIKNGYQTKILGQPIDWETYTEEELKYLDAEENRLVYVAATRAKNILFISSSLKNNKKNPWKLLLQNLVDENIVEIPDVDKPILDKDVGIGIPKDKYEEEQKHYQDWIKVLSIKSYETASSTDYEDKKKLWEVKRLEGGGQAWGTANHKVFEELVKGEEDLETLIEKTLIENDLHLDRKHEVETIVDNFKKSDLWNRIKNSEVKYTEVPFTIKIDKDHQLYDVVKLEDDIPVILSGVIDLVFKEDDGWVIVDYKTDMLEDEKQYDVLEDAYKNQLEIYKGVWEGITGEKVEEAKIKFTNK